MIVRKARIFGVCAVFLVAVGAASHARALAIKEYGLGPMGMGKHGLGTVLIASGSRALRLGGKMEVADGKGIVGRFEGGALYKRSIFGNPAGLAVGGEVGYIGNSIDTTSADDLLSSMGILCHMWLGFPVHAFGMGGDNGGLRLFVEPGVGVDFVHLYAYIKGKVSFALPGGALGGELSYQWTPMEMSSTWGTTGRGQNMAQLRAVVFIPGTDFHGFIDLTQSNMERYDGNGDLSEPASKAYSKVDPLQALERDPFLRIWRLGVGKTF